MNKINTELDTKVYFNNSCSICRFEINHYKKLSNEINWIDVTQNSEAEKETSKKAILIMYIEWAKLEQTMRFIDFCQMALTQMKNSKINLMRMSQDQSIGVDSKLYQMSLNFGKMEILDYMIDLF